MNISIIGLGWLGEALAYKLIENGHVVKGTTTSVNKIEPFKKNGIETYLYSLGEALPNDLIDCETLIITIPPRTHNYVDDLKKLRSSIEVNSQVIFISSTSVYPNTNKEVIEEEAEDITSPHSGISLSKAENVFKNNNTTYLRFAGLFGPDRHPGRFLAGKKNVAGAECPVNLIHLDDCIGLILSVIENKVMGEAINGCSDLHPAKKEFYTKAAEKLSLEPPSFNRETQPFKIISNTKSKEILDYEYKYPDPLKALDLI